MSSVEYNHLSVCKPAVSVAQDKCHPQTIEVCRTRAEGLGLEVIIGDEAAFAFDKDVSGVLLQYPATDGSVLDYSVQPFSCHHKWPVNNNVAILDVP